MGQDDARLHVSVGGWLPLQVVGARDAGQERLGIVGCLEEEPKAGIEAVWGGTNAEKIKG